MKILNLIVADRWNAAIGSLHQKRKTLSDYTILSAARNISQSMNTMLKCSGLGLFSPTTGVPVSLPSVLTAALLKIRPQPDNNWFLFAAGAFGLVITLNNTPSQVRVGVKLVVQPLL